jgi:hypothetical protein
MTDTEITAAERVASAAEDYAPQEHRPLAGYAALSTIYTAAAAGSLFAAWRRRGELPSGYGVWDLVTVGAASHKLSRLLSMDKVTSFVRAPFVRYEEPAGHGELSEEPRGRGLRLATGELLNCPYCLGLWSASALGIGLVGAPRLTRLIAFTLTAETVSDFLQLAYKGAEEAV